MEGENLKTELLQVARDIDNEITMNRSDARVVREAACELIRLEGQLRGAGNAPAQPVTHAELVRLIGEVDGVSLESESRTGCPTLQDVVVYLEVAGKRVELIRTLRTGEGEISHHLTRLGIGEGLRPAYPANGGAGKDRGPASPAVDLKQELRERADLPPGEPVSETMTKDLCRDALARIEALESEAANRLRRAALLSNLVDGRKERS